MKKFKFLLGIILIIVLSVGCSNSSNVVTSNLTPEQVVRLHFKLWNEKNVSKLEATIVPSHRGITWEMDKLQYVKLININEDKTQSEENRKVFNVEFEIKFKDGYGSGMTDGKYIRNFTVEREKADGDWFISNWGEG